MLWQTYAAANSPQVLFLNMPDHNDFFIYGDAKPLQGTNIFLVIIKYSIKAVDIAMSQNFLVLISILMQIKLASNFPLPSHVIISTAINFFPYFDICIAGNN